MASSTTEPTTLRKAEEDDDDEDSKPSAEDEDTGAHVAPIVRLQEVSVTTGEENEDVLLDLKAKLYRFDKEGNQWKERGVGTVKLLKHQETGKVRLVMRQKKTLKICANHLVLPSLSVQEHQGNDKSCVWHAADFADGELKEETFCIRFASVESELIYFTYNMLYCGFQTCKSKPGAGHEFCRGSEEVLVDCKSFKEKIEEITKSQAEAVGESAEAVTAANLIEKLSVESKENEEKPGAKKAPLSGVQKELDE